MAFTTKYERLNTCESGGSNTLEGEVELCLDQEHHKKQSSSLLLPLPSKNGSVNKERTNFNYINNSSSSANAATSSAQQIQNAADGMTMARQADARFKQMAIGTLFTVLLYLTLSIVLTFYQNDIIKKLKFPLTIVTYHLIIKYFLSSLVRTCYRLRVGKSRVQLDWRVAVRKMAPAGFTSAIDIGFSNWGLELVPISLYTMTKSSTIIFILLFAILLGLERKSWYLVLIVGLIAVGLFMFTYKSTQFNALGFFFILFASLSSGLRWSFAQFIMQKSKLGLHNPVDMIYHMQPWMIVSLLPFVVVFEGQPLYNVFLNLKNLSNNVIAWTLTKVTFGALLAFLMEIGEFLVLSKTSSLTLSIAGIFKDICQLFLAVELNNDQLTPINVIGLVVCLCGICCHLLHKYSSMSRQDKQHALHSDEEENMPAEYNFSKSSSSAPVGVHGATSNSTSGGAHSTLTVPLLEQTDSEEESSNEANGGHKQNASDVIFDVLKRRDMQR